jgi:hypothetical protein
MEFQEGTFQLGRQGGPQGPTEPIGGVTVSADGEAIGMSEGTLTIRRVGETVEGTIRGSGSATRLSGRRVSGRVSATFVAVLGPPAP